MRRFIPHKALSRLSNWLTKNQHSAVIYTFLSGLLLLIVSYIPEIRHALAEGGFPKQISDTGYWQALFEKHWQTAARHTAHALLPASAAIAMALVYFRHAGAQFDSFQTHFFRSHTIICGLSTRARLLADDLIRQGSDVVIISLKHDHNDVTEQRIKGVAILHGDACDMDMLKKAGFLHAAQLVCMTDSDETNISILDVARQIAVQQKTSQGREPEITCYCHIRNTALRAQLDRVPLMASKSEGTRFRPFNADEITAAELLHRFPPERHLPRKQQSDGTHVMLLGNSSLFFSLAMQMAQQCHYWRENPYDIKLPRTRLSIVAPDSVDQLGKLIKQCPAIEQLLDIQAVQLAPEGPAIFDELSQIKSPPVSQYYIALTDEISTLAVANTLTRALQSMGQPTGDRIIAITPARLKQIDPTAWSEASAITVLPSYESFKADIIFGKARDQIAMETHQRYLRTTIGLGKRLGDSPALFEWDGLSELLRDSNRQQVAHMDIKLRAIGWPVDTPPIASREIAGDLLEQLADMEHRRWMAFHYIRGWRHAQTRRDAFLEHDCLVPYTELPEEIREYDRNTVREMISAWHISEPAGEPN